MSVNKLRQKYAGSELASVAKKLIKQWKKLVPSGSCESNIMYNEGISKKVDGYCEIGRILQLAMTATVYNYNA